MKPTSKYRGRGLSGKGLALREMPDQGRGVDGRLYDLFELW